MNPKPTAALLPLYLKLYDDVLPRMRAVLEPFLDQVTAGLADQGLDVVRLPVCRVQGEFSTAVAAAQARDADMLICLHLAYSPSLESAGALSASPLPIVLLDTTMDWDFGPSVDPGRLSYNHGIHGVQDLACVLRRLGKPFEIVAGHAQRSDVLGRAAQMVRAARAARKLPSARVLRIGKAFAGMGDFAVDEDVLGRLGIQVRQVGLEALFPLASDVSDQQVEQELARDRRLFACEVDEAVHRRSLRVGLALRRYLEVEGFDAFSANFEAFDRGEPPIDTVPFLEISKAMSRGVGYAGEGDVLTAALVGALLAGWERTTFTEIFCPDWSGQSLFLSHMGEINPAVAASRPVVYEKDFPFTPARNPAVLAAAMAPGPAVLVNLAPGPQDSFRLIVAPVEVLGDGTHPAMRTTVRGWVRPATDLGGFLEEYSRLGGTHHLALVMGAQAEALAAMGRMTGLDVRVIR